MFFYAFKSVLMFLDAFGPIRIHSDLFGCVRMRLDAFGNKWRVSEKIGFFCFFQLFQTLSDVFAGFMEFSNITPSFHTFLGVLDNFSYLLSLVIYRERPLGPDGWSGLIRGRFGVDSGSIRVDSGSIQVRFGVDSGSVRGSFGVHSGRFTAVRNFRKFRKLFI